MLFSMLRLWRVLLSLTQPVLDLFPPFAPAHSVRVHAPCSCMPAYTHPTSRGTGVLNLANHLPWYVLKPDLGPKGYIAYGR